MNDAHPRPWQAHLECGGTTATSVPATPGNWVGCPHCHTQRLIISVSRALSLVPAGIQGELFTRDELRGAA